MHELTGRFATTQHLFRVFYTFSPLLGRFQQSAPKAEFTPLLLGVAANSAGLQINIGKTKIGQKDIENPISVDGSQIQNVEYLDSLVTWDNNCST